MNIAERIMKIRKQRGMSQEDLADRLGVSRQAVSKWESAQANPDIRYIIQISELFEISTDYILLGKEIENNNIVTITETINEKKTDKLIIAYNHKFWLGALVMVIGFVSILFFIIASIKNPHSYIVVTGREYKNLAGYLMGNKLIPYFVVCCVFALSGLCLCIYCAFANKSK